MVHMIVPTILGLSCSGLTAWLIRTREPVDVALLPSYVGLPGPWSREAFTWTQNPERRRLVRLNGIVLLAFLTMAVLTFGVLRGVGVVLLTLIAAWLLGGAGVVRDHVIEPALQRAGTLVRERAHAFRAAGDSNRAAAAEDFAARIDRFRRSYGRLSPADFSQYTPPAEIAWLLESYYLPADLLPADRDMPQTLREEAPPRSGDDSDIDLPAWLSEAIVPLSPDAEEQARAALLNRVRDEIIRGGGPRYADLTRLRELIVELRRAV